MKDKEKTKPTKKKILLRYLIIAACLLVIAAICVAVVFAVNSNSVNLADTGTVVEPEDKEPDDKEPEKDVSSATEFRAPVKDVDLTQAQVFFFDSTLNRYTDHVGVDFKADAGTQVLAAVDGEVVDIVTGDRLFESYIVLKHANDVETVYRFVKPKDGLKKGDIVDREEVIGTIIAATGVENEMGDHLHFEVYCNGKITDPENYLQLQPK